MIVFNNKSYIKMELYPNTDWIGNADWVLDDNDPEDAELEEKIINNYPNFEFVFDEDGRPIDITTTEPIPEPYEPTIEDYMLDMDFRLSCLELGI